MLSIHIKSLPLVDMRYHTLGDFLGDENQRLIMVAETGDWRKEFLIAFHEQIEQSLCFLFGVSERDVKAFDEMFEKEVEQGLHSPDDEPGDDPRAPYFLFHQLATKLERELCEVGFKMKWDEDYMKPIYKLFEDTFYKEKRETEN